MGIIESSFGVALLLCVACFGALLLLGGLIFLLVKLGVIASYWSKPAPADAGNQTLSQSREAAAVPPASEPTPPESPKPDTDANAGHGI